jgi:hypothetical protein
MRASIASSPNGLGDLRLALSPADTYRRLLVHGGETTWARVFLRPVLTAVLVGVSVAIAATGRLTPSLLLSTTMAWSWVVAVQWGFAIAMTRPLPRDGSLSAARAFECWFAGHVPWTLWVLMLAPLLRMAPDTPAEVLILSALVPMGWTAAIATAFGRVVLQRSDAESRLRAGVHQAVLLFAILSYVAWSAGGWFRLVE